MLRWRSKVGEDCYCLPMLQSVTSIGWSAPLRLSSTCVVTLSPAAPPIPQHAMMCILIVWLQILVLSILKQPVKKAPILSLTLHRCNAVIPNSWTYSVVRLHGHWLGLRDGSPVLQFAGGTAAFWLRIRTPSAESTWCVVCTNVAYWC